CAAGKPRRAAAMKNPRSLTAPGAVQSACLSSPPCGEGDREAVEGATPTADVETPLCDQAAVFLRDGETISFLVSAIALAGFSPLGQTWAQFMMVWQRYSLKGSSRSSRRFWVASSRLSAIQR